MFSMKKRDAECDYKSKYIIGGTKIDPLFKKANSYVYFFLFGNLDTPGYGVQPGDTKCNEKIHH